MGRWMLCNNSPALLVRYSFSLSRKSCWTGSREEALVCDLAPSTAPTLRGLHACTVHLEEERARRVHNAAIFSQTLTSMVTWGPFTITWLNGSPDPTHCGWGLEIVLHVWGLEIVLHVFMTLPLCFTHYWKMVHYELAVIFRALGKSDLPLAVRRACCTLLDQGSVVRAMENRGERRLPYRMGAHKERFSHGR